MVSLLEWRPRKKQNLGQSPATCYYTGVISSALECVIQTDILGIWRNSDVGSPPICKTKAVIVKKSKWESLRLLLHKDKIKKIISHHVWMGEVSATFKDLKGVMVVAPVISLLNIPLYTCRKQINERTVVDYHNRNQTVALRISFMRVMTVARED